MTADLLRECECGCGLPAPVAVRSDLRRGHVKGEPIRFIKGHGRKTPYVAESDRFWAKVRKTEGCWLWMAGTRRGYGHFHREDGLGVGAHRWAYEALVGPIPGDLTIDHLCGLKACVNPEHLEPVTRGENSRRAAPTLLTNRCKRDHEFSTENTYVRRDGTRQCRACHRARQRGYSNVS